MLPFVPKQILAYNASQNQPYPSLDIGATLNGTKLLTQMSQSGEVKSAQASLSFRLWQNWEKLAELRLHYLT